MKDDKTLAALREKALVFTDTIGHLQQARDCLKTGHDFQTDAASGIKFCIKCGNGHQSARRVDAALSASPERQALDMLAGLHPGLTTEGGAMAEAVAIFDAVTANETALKRRIKELGESLDYAYRRTALAASPPVQQEPQPDLVNYALTQAEHGILQRTLMKSVKTVNPAPNAAVPAVGSQAVTLAFVAVQQEPAPGMVWTVIGPDGSRFTDETPLKAAVLANRHRVKVDPVAAKQFTDVIEKLRQEGQEEREQCEAKFATLDCPACGGSGHVGDCTGAAGAPLTREEFYRVLATQPQEVARKPLTDDQIHRIWLETTDHSIVNRGAAFIMARAIEAAHGIGIYPVDAKKEG